MAKRLLTRGAPIACLKLISSSDGLTFMAGLGYAILTARKKCGYVVVAATPHEVIVGAPVLAKGPNLVLYTVFEVRVMRTFI